MSEFNWNYFWTKMLKKQLPSSFQTEEPKNKGVLFHQHDIKTSHLSKVGRGFHQACLFSINILSLLSI